MNEAVSQSGFVSYDAVESRHKEQMSEFRRQVEDGWQEPPNIDLREDYFDFSKTLRVVPEEERDHRLRSYVEAQVKEKLRSWSTKVKPLRILRERVEEFSRMLDQEKDENSVQMRALQSEVTDLRGHIDGLRNNRAKLRAELANVRAPSTVSKVLHWMLIAAVALIALATAYYYLQTQGQIIVAQNGGPSSYFDSGSERFTLSEFLSQSPGYIIYAFPALIFVVGGKLAGAMYESVGRPTWMFITTVLLALGVVIGTGVLLGFSSEQSFILGQAQIELARAQEQIDAQTLLTGVALDCGVAANATAGACPQFLQAQEAVNTARDTVGGLTFWLTIVVIFAEVIVGAAVWMLHEDYQSRHDENGGKLRASEATLHDTIGTKEQELARLEQRIDEHGRINAFLSQEQGDIAVITGRIHGGEEIERLTTDILNKEVQIAYSQYYAAKTEWPSGHNA